MTREEFWVEVFMESFRKSHYHKQASDDANDALAAYNEALKKYGEACKDAPVWPKGSLPWAMTHMKDGERYSDRIRRKATGDFPNRLMPYDMTALDWEFVE